MRSSIVSTTANEAAQKKSDVLDAAAEQARLAKEAQNKAEEAPKKEQEQIEKDYDGQLAQFEQFQTALDSEKLAFRQRELTDLQQYGDRYKELQEKLLVEIGHLTQQDFAEGERAREKDLKDEQRYQEELAKFCIEWGGTVLVGPFGVPVQVPGKKNYEATADLNKSNITNPTVDASGKELPNIIGQSAADGAPETCYNRANTLSLTVKSCILHQPDFPPSPPLNRSGPATRLRSFAVFSHGFWNWD